MNENLKKMIEGNIENLYNPVRRQKIKNLSTEDMMGAIEMVGGALVDGFVIDNDNRRVYENLAKWLINDITMEAQDARGLWIPGDPRRGIYLSGNTGTGKSVAIDIIGKIAGIMNIRVMFNTYSDSRPLSWRTYLSTGICDEYAREGDLDIYKKEDILCINDLGGEIEKDSKGRAMADTLYMGNRRNVLRQVLEARGDKPAQITIITSNYKLNGEVIQQVYGSRVVSRLMKMCNVYELLGKDRRRI